MVCTSSYQSRVGFEITFYEGLLNFNVNCSYMGSSGQNQPHREHLKLQALGNLLMDFLFPYSRNLFVSAFAVRFVARPLSVFSDFVCGSGPPIQRFLTGQDLLGT